MLQGLEWPTLQLQRKKSMSRDFLQVPQQPYHNELWVQNISIQKKINQTREQQQKLDIPMWRTLYRQKTFSLG